MDNLEQLAQLAKVTALLTSPQQQQQEIDQKDQAARLQAAIHLMGLQQEQQQNAAQLAELQRYHTGELQHGQESLKSNVLDSLVSHLSQRPDVPLGVLATTLRKGGHSELADALDEVHQQNRAAAITGLVPQLRAVKDEKARALLQPTVAQYPGAFEEALQQVGGEAAPAQTEPLNLGAATGATLRRLPGLPIKALQGLDTKLTNFGSNFWAGLLGYTPQDLAGMEDKNRRTLKELGFPTAGQ